MNVKVLWVLTPCRSEGARRFGWIHHLHFQGLRWRRYVPMNRRVLSELHGVTTEKTGFFIVTGGGISNPAPCEYTRI
jgi:hypothetical protein